MATSTDNAGGKSLEDEGNHGVLQVEMVKGGQVLPGRRLPLPGTARRYFAGA